MYKFSYLDSAGQTQYTETDQDLRQTAGGSKFTLEDNAPQPTPQPTQTTQKPTQPTQKKLTKQQELQAAQQRIASGSGNNIDKANVNYAYKTGLLKRVEVNNTPKIQPPLELGDVSSGLTTDDFKTSMVDPKNVIPDTSTQDFAFRTQLANYTNNAFDGIDQQLANLNNQLLEYKQKEIEREQAEKDRLATEYETAGQISLYDKGEELMERFQVEANLKLMQDLQKQGLDAYKTVQNAVDSYDSSTFLTSVVSGRKNQLVRQGLNVITSIQATAEIVKGNIDTGMDYVDQMVGYLDADRATQLNTYGSLLSLSNNKLITLKKDEKELIKANMDALKKEGERIQKDKDKVFDIYVADPYLANKASVYFTDTPKEAIEKISNFLIENPSYNIDMIKELTTTDSAGNKYVVGLNKYTGEQMYKTRVGEKTITKSSQGVDSSDFPKGFWTAIKVGISLLQKGEEWGTVFDRLKMQFPNISDEKLDKALGVEWRDEGAFEKWKSKQYKVTPTRQFELESTVWQWLSSKEALNMSDEQKKQEIMLAGFNPEDFGIY